MQYCVALHTRYSNPNTISKVHSTQPNKSQQIMLLEFEGAGENPQKYPYEILIGQPGPHPETRVSGGQLQILVAIGIKATVSVKPWAQCSIRCAVHQQIESLSFIR